MAKGLKLTRKQYKDLKRMDHQQIEGFVLNLYNEGFSEGVAAAKKRRIKPSDIAIAITEVKGIGTKKAAEIMEAINNLYDKGTRNEQKAEEKEL